jgi:hypothetical protein
MSYAILDFSESLGRVPIGPPDIVAVVAAWGYGEGQGTDGGHGYSADGATEWSGGFLLKLKDGRFAYLTGWCDYTGWGCQDGAEVTYFDALPSLTSLEADPPTGWDEQPADLNRWLSSGAQDPHSLP